MRRDCLGLFFAGLAAFAAGCQSTKNVTVDSRPAPAAVSLTEDDYAAELAAITPVEDCEATVEDPLSTDLSINDSYGDGEGANLRGLRLEAPKPLECKNCADGVTYKCVRTIEKGSAAVCDQSACTITMLQTVCDRIGVKTDEKGKTSEVADPTKRPMPAKALGLQETVDYIISRCTLTHEARHACQEKIGGEGYPGCKAEAEAYDITGQCINGYIADNCKKEPEILNEAQCSVLKAQAQVSVLRKKMMDCHCEYKPGDAAKRKEEINNKAAECWVACDASVDQLQGFTDAAKKVMKAACKQTTTIYFDLQSQFPK